MNIMVDDFERRATMNFNRIGKLNELLTYNLKRKPTIMLDSNPD